MLISMFLIGHIVFFLIRYVYLKKRDKKISIRPTESEMKEIKNFEHMVNHTAIYTDVVFKNQKRRTVTYEESKHEITLEDIGNFKKKSTLPYK
mmetsp:Transcript_11603/g.10270  ORF Transcript_11603/g.10270 Transcript_11603/m.10270 type:complete len:93 (+) Transcript_11603:374-652(+)